MKKDSYSPTFHTDGSITYWRDSYGWQHRVHPSKVHPRSLAGWTRTQIERWEDAMRRRGFVKVRGAWRPLYKIPR